MDRFSKYPHFMAIVHPHCAVIVATIFMNNVYNLHGFSGMIVSDKEPVFPSRFWKHLFAQQGVDQRVGLD